MKQVSATTFIRNAFQGGFPVFESMATFLALPIEEFVILDLGSTDGTLETLRQIEGANSRVRLEQGEWPVIDASAFAEVSNQCIALCKSPCVLWYQADEVWHPHLLKMMEERWDNGEYDLSFWRYQLKYNFQELKWCTHIVHRSVIKGESVVVGDGMNTNRTMDARLVSTWSGGWFQRWGKEFEGRYHEMPTREFILDSHACWDLNLVGWRELHAPMWHESEDLIVPDRGIHKKEWLEMLESEDMQERLQRKESPYDLPAILRGCVGQGRYVLREEVLDALMRDDTGGIVWSLPGGGIQG